MTVCILCLQMLLRNNVTAYFFRAQLNGTQWSVQDLSSFLTKHSEDTRPPGTAFTWRNVFNETDQAIMSISRFMEVSLYTCTLLWPYFTKRKSSSVTIKFILQSSWLTCRLQELMTQIKWRSGSKEASGNLLWRLTQGDYPLYKIERKSCDLLSFSL